MEKVAQHSIKMSKSHKRKKVDLLHHLHLAIIVVIQIQNLKRKKFSQSKRMEKATIGRYRYLLTLRICLERN